MTVTDTTAKSQTAALSFEFDLPHAPEKVWRALLTIPYGETRSYEDIARVVGSPRGVRAVGRANGLNRIAIVIPCHRVVNKGGKLGGYGGGLWRKQILLDLERGEQHALELGTREGTSKA